MSNISYGDLDGDGVVTTSDLNLLGGFIENNDLSGDLNGDGITDMTDLQTLYINLNKSFDDGIFMQGGDGDDLAIGGNGNDIILTNGGNDTIIGGAGDDLLLSGDGDDIVVGGAGNDYIDAGPGSNIVVGGGGNDTFVLSFANPDLTSNTYRSDTIKDFGTGNDTLQIADNTAVVTQYMINQSSVIGEFTSLFVWASADNAEYLYAFAMLEGMDSFLKGYAGVVNVMHGGIYGDNMVGGKLGDTLNGNGGNDNINGRQGDDAISGGDGNDVLRGAKGDDTLDGGAGDDILFGGKGSNVMSSGSGNDLMIARGDETLVFTNADFEDNDAGDVVRGFNKGDSIDLTNIEGDLYYAASDGENGVTLNIVVNTHNAPISPNWIHHSVLFENTHDLDLVESSVIL